MNEYLIWGILLILQNSSHTLTSRARNSKSLIYNSLASISSNGIWFASQFFIVNTLVQAKDKGGWFLLGVGVYYILLTVIGSVGAHWLAMKYERGKAAK